MEATVRRVRNGSVELAVESRGRGPALVVGHGLTGTRHVSFEQYAPLEDDYTVIAFDQRGHGDSTPLVGVSDYDPQALANDVAAVMDGLGLDRAVIAAESMGAVGALMFALQHQERVEQLLLTGPAFGDTISLRREWLHDIGREILAVGYETYLANLEGRLRNDLGLDEQATAARLAIYKSHDPTSLATAFLATSEWVPFPDLGVLEGLHVPVSIVAWPGDDLHPLTLAQRMAARLPVATLEQVSGILQVLTDPASAVRPHFAHLSQS